MDVKGIAEAAGQEGKCPVRNPVFAVQGLQTLLISRDSLAPVFLFGLMAGFFDTQSALAICPS